MLVDGGASSRPGLRPTGRPFGFRRSFRLKRRRLIRPLFARDRPDVGRVAAGAIQIRYRVVPREATGADAPLQVGFAPGRRTTKVARNRVRRLMREAWRLHQRPLASVLAARPDTLTVFVVFRGREDAAAEAIPRDLPEALRRLAARFAGHSERASPGGPPTP